MPTHPFPFHSYLTDLEAVPHGGSAQLIAQGLDPTTLIDFSANILPIETPPAVKRAIRNADPRPYPDPHCTQLRDVLSKRHNIPSGNILCANGSVELIGAIARACLSANDKALIVGPTFGEYEAAVRLVQATPIVISTTNAAEVTEAIEMHQPTMVFLCNPNNPTGHLWSEDDLDRIAAKAPLVLDEAYASFLQSPRPPYWGDGKIVLRSLTKDHAMAGLRIGYAIAPPQDIAALARTLTPWSVNSIAQNAAIAALSNPAPYQQAINALWSERDRLIEKIEDLGWSIVNGATPFFLVEVDDARECYQRLLNLGVVVRDCTSFGLPKHIRISPKHPQDGDVLLQALENKPLDAAQQKGTIRLVLGGARSGKSEYAEQLALTLGNGRVSYIATAQAFDSEMEDRIKLHQQRRDDSWETMERPFDVSQGIATAQHSAILLDCLTLLITNWFLKHDAKAAEQEVLRLIDQAKRRRGDTVIVSNEIGSGIVPMNAMSRQFRDLQGRINQLVANAADEAVLVVAGQPIRLK